MNSKVLVDRMLAALMSLLTVAAAPKEERNRVIVRDPSFHFEIVGLDQPVEHTFTFTNPTQSVLRISRVVVTAPIVFKEADSSIAPGAEGKVSFYVGAPRIAGEFEGQIEVQFSEESIEPAVFSVTGNIRPFIECRPLPAFYIAAPKGQSKSSSIELINHERTPLQILSMTSPSEKFAARLETVKEGRLFRLHVDVLDHAPSGRTEDKIVLSTSSPSMPMVTVPVYLFVKERIYTFPDRVDLGEIRISEFQENRMLAPLLSQVLMVYRQAGKGDFNVTAETDVPFLKLSTVMAEHKNSCEVKVDVMVDWLRPGPIQGSIRLSTDDPEFPVLCVPVNTKLTR